MRDCEHQQWIEYVRRLEEKKGKKPWKPHTKKPPEVSPAELEQALDITPSPATGSAGGRPGATAMPGTLPAEESRCAYYAHRTPATVIMRACEHRGTARPMGFLVAFARVHKKSSYPYIYYISLSFSL